MSDIRRVLIWLGAAGFGVIALGALLLRDSFGLVDAAVRLNPAASWVVFHICPRRDGFFVERSVAFVLSNGFAEEWESAYLRAFVERLLQCGASASSEDPHWNAMDAAVTEHDEAMVKLLLRYGGQSTPFYCAIFEEHRDVYARELELGVCDSAPPSAQDQERADGPRSIEVTEFTGTHLAVEQTN